MWQGIGGPSKSIDGKKTTNDSPNMARQTSVHIRKRPTSVASDDIGESSLYTSFVNNVGRAKPCPAMISEPVRPEVVIGGSATVPRVQRPMPPHSAGTLGYGRSSSVFKLSQSVGREVFEPALVTIPFRKGDKVLLRLLSRGRRACCRRRGSRCRLPPWRRHPCFP